MPDVQDFTPIFSETLARVRARMDADVNAGLVLNDPAWIDTREGSFYWDVTQVTALEFARLWDAIGSESVAAAFPSTAWGEYLDEHAVTFGLVRNPAVAATGEVTFGGDPGSLVAANTKVSASPADPSLDAVSFVTTDSGTTCPLLNPPSGVAATPSNTSGSLPAATYIYHVTSYNEFGETTASADVSATITTITGLVALTWTADPDAVGYRVYRTVTVGVPGQLIADTNNAFFTDDGTVALGASEPSENTTSGVTLPVIAETTGSDTSLSALAITNLDTLVPGIRTVYNTSPTEGGADVEDDDALRLRVLAQYAGQGAGNQQDYVRWSLAYPGVERATCIPVWAGPQTVLVIPMLSDGSPVSSTIVDGLQTSLMPVAAQGVGQAPIGAIVTVETTVPLDIAIVATVQLAPGYSLDGLSGTIPTRLEIEAVLGDYLLSINPGDTIFYQQLQAEFFTVTGVRNVTGMTINGGTANIVLGVTPPQYPRLLTPTLS